MGTIPNSERAELRRIVKARFALLGEELRMREGQIQLAISDEIERLNQKKLDTARAKLDELHAKADALNKEFVKFAKDADARGLEVETNVFRGYRDEWVVVAANGVAVKDQNVTTHRVFEKLSAQSGAASLDFKRRELELMEALSLSALSSDSAKRFLDSIPTADSLLPPNDVIAPAVKNELKSGD